MANKNIWDDMDMTGWTSGLTAVDEDTYRKKVIEEEDLVRACLLYTSDAADE